MSKGQPVVTFKPPILVCYGRGDGRCTKSTVPGSDYCTEHGLEAWTVSPIEALKRGVPVPEGFTLSDSDVLTTASDGSITTDVGAPDWFCAQVAASVGAKWHGGPQEKVYLLYCVEGVAIFVNCHDVQGPLTISTNLAIDEVRTFPFLWEVWKRIPKRLSFEDAARWARRQSAQLGELDSSVSNVVTQNGAAFDPLLEEPGLVAYINQVSRLGDVAKKVFTKCVGLIWDALVSPSRYLGLTGADFESATQHVVGRLRDLDARSDLTSVERAERLTWQPVLLHKVRDCVRDGNATAIPGLAETIVKASAVLIEALQDPLARRTDPYKVPSGTAQRIHNALKNESDKMKIISERIFNKRYGRIAVSIPPENDSELSRAVLTVCTVVAYLSVDPHLTIELDQAEIDAVAVKIDDLIEVLNATGGVQSYTQLVPDQPILARDIEDLIQHYIVEYKLSDDLTLPVMRCVAILIKALHYHVVSPHSSCAISQDKVIEACQPFTKKLEEASLRLGDFIAQQPQLFSYIRAVCSRFHDPEAVTDVTALAIQWAWIVWTAFDADQKRLLSREEIEVASNRVFAMIAAAHIVEGSYRPELLLPRQLDLCSAVDELLSGFIDGTELDDLAFDTVFKMAMIVADALDTRHRTSRIHKPAARFTQSQVEAARVQRDQKAKAEAANKVPSNWRVYLREFDGAACFIDIDPEHSVQQLKEVIGSPFDAITWENVAPGAHLVQLVGRSESAPSVWLRTRLNTRGASAGSRKVSVNGKRTTVPLTRFVPAAVSTLLADDAALIEMKFYAVQPNAAPAVQTGAVDAATHEAIVANYLGICERLNSLVDAVEVASPEAGAAERTKQDAERIWPSLRDAVIFELSSDAYVQLYEEFAYYIARSAKVSIHPSESIEKILDQLTPAAEKRVTEMVRSGAAAPFPERLPFKSCFFAYGAGVNETERLAVPAFVVGADTGTILGHLVCESGEVVRFAWRSVGDEVALQFESERLPGQFSWTQPHNLAPWIVNALVDYVNEHKTLIEMGKIGAVYRATVKKITARLKLQPVPPPPFYVVYMKDNYVRETGVRQAALIKRHIDWQHRWKVRGHDCIRFQRGPLPLDPELLERFVKRGYKVFTDTLPDAETFADLHKRGVSEKGPDEWIAILKYWREPYEKGPDDKPLIESVRRSTKKFDPLPDDVN